MAGLDYTLYYLAGCGLAAFVIYVFSLVVYRLYLSPVARFPGPRLAALTNWYEFYYDVIREGEFTWHIQKLHKKYGMSPFYSIRYHYPNDSWTRNPPQKSAIPSTPAVLREHAVPS